MAMRARAARACGAVLLAGAMAVGCAHWDLDEPAPGLVDVSSPPPLLEQRHIVPARPAGERVLAVNPGVLGSLGIRAGTDGAATWASWSGEVSLHWGKRDSYHVDEFSREPEPSIIAFHDSWALTVGASTRSAARAPGVPNRGDVYLEFERMSSFSGVAAGPVWNPTTGKVGGQVTAFLGMAHARVTAFDLNPVFQIGLTLKAPFSWIWSR